ncbi:MAG TPA: DUF948 domain-containing protein [Vicinamibacterales bacterium]|nr:DUF948 domain-containing protein [Vicinamibacterales bacterium]
MNESATVFLGVMAVSLAVMAIIQVALIVAGLLAIRKLGAVADELRREIAPLMDKVNRIADDASRMTSLAALQVERVDQFMATTATRVDQTLGVVQSLLSGPVRQSTVLIAAFRAAMAAFRGWQDHKSRKSDAPIEDEDTWFVG